MRAMDSPIAMIGVPSALGGQLPDGRHHGMAAAPGELRRRGFVERLSAAGHAIRDDGDVPLAAGYRDDPDPRTKNRDLIVEYLPREVEMVAASVGAGERLLILGGDCCAHAGAMGGLRRARPDRRLAIAWFDAHGDFNTPEMTPSGNVWGMPFAMLCGRGPADLVGACGGPAVDERHAAHIGGQFLDDLETRAIVASPVAHFGAGMLRTPAGMAALSAWAGVVATEVDGLYIAIDHDVLDADEAPWAVTMPEVAGVPIGTAVEAVEVLAAAMPVVGYGATAMNFDRGDGERTVDAATRLAEAAFGTR
jgi:arginase